MTQPPRESYESMYGGQMGFYDADWYDGLGGHAVPATTRMLRDHEHLLQEALYLNWSKSNGKSYQALADCYNTFALREGEEPLRPPPSYI